MFAFYCVLCTMLTLSFATIHSTQVTPNITSTLYAQADKLKSMPSYRYPYNDLAQKLSAEGKKSLPLFSYGSLVDPASASLTLSKQALKTRRPALAFGVIRAFDRDITVKPDSKWGTPCHQEARGMLNIQPSPYLEQFINGVLLDVPLKDIDALLKREIGYDLIPVVIADWQSMLDGKLNFDYAYILHAQRDSVYVNTAIFPRPGYYELTRNAATQYGPLFSLLWLNTTFMADGHTPIAVWEQWLKTQDPRTCVSEKHIKN
jgi:hypothetical protein